MGVLCILHPLLTKNLTRGLAISISIIAILFLCNASFALGKKTRAPACNNLKFGVSEKLELGNIRIKLDIPNFDKWRAINEINFEWFNRNSTFINKHRIRAILLIKSGDITCYLTAKIRPHGDTLKHHQKLYETREYTRELPSLNINLTQGNISGIVDFVLFKPKTRSSEIEVFITTLLRQLELPAPRTSMVTISFGKLNHQFIFQEKINKEFLESNAIIEGALLEGDERLFGICSLKCIQELKLTKHRVSNTNWASKIQANSQQAHEALEFLNIVNHFYRDDLHENEATTNEPLDYFHVFQIAKLEKYDHDPFKKLPLFDALMFSARCEHGLSADDRRFYFDALKKVYTPIYYDGQCKLGLDAFDLRKNVFEINQYGFNKVYLANSALRGAAAALKLFDKLDVELFKQQLGQNGVDISLDLVSALLHEMRENLNYMNNFPVKAAKSNPYLKVPTPLKKATWWPFEPKERIRYRQNPKMERGSGQIVGNILLKNEDSYMLCELEYHNCESYKVGIKQRMKALGQRLTDNTGKDIYYFGQFKNFVGVDNVKQIELSKFFQHLAVKQVGGSTLMHTDGIEISINAKQKTINVVKTRSNEKVVFLGGELNGWAINFQDNSKNNLELSLRDEFNLSGCLNFYDLSVEKLMVYVNGARCEDAVNFVRTKGTINNLTVSDSFSDGIDLDFSNLTVKQMKINNSGGDCLDLSFGNYVIEDGQIHFCGDKAISSGERSKTKIHQLAISNSFMGVASKDNSRVLILNGSIINSKICFGAYNKKQEFDGGLITYNDVDCKKYSILHQIDPVSRIIY